jgi:hypothetical protein
MGGGANRPHPPTVVKKERGELGERGSGVPAVNTTAFTHNNVSFYESRESVVHDV